MCMGIPQSKESDNDLGLWWSHTATAITAQQQQQQQNSARNNNNSNHTNTNNIPKKRPLTTENDSSKGNNTTNNYDDSNRNTKTPILPKIIATVATRTLHPPTTPTVLL